MRLDKRFIVVVSVSLVWALVVSVTFYRVAGSCGRRRGAPEKKIVVATRMLPAGSTLERDAVTLKSVPEGMAPAGAFSRVEDVLERPVISPIEPDEPVVEARLAVRGSGMGLGPMIPPGMRAVSVRVNDVVGVAGFVLPGMRVDVLMTGRPPNGTDTETQTVLQNIAVLSAGQTIQTDAKQTDAKSQAIVAPVVTLLVSPREAESLALANNEGHIQLVLRNSTDRTVVATTGRRLHELYGATALQAAGPSAAPAAGPKPVVRVAAGHRAATVAAPPVPVPAAVEPDQMIVIRGSVKKVEYFSREQEGK